LAAKVHLDHQQFDPLPLAAEIHYRQHFDPWRLNAKGSFWAPTSRIWRPNIILIAKHSILDPWRQTQAFILIATISANISIFESESLALATNLPYEHSIANNSILGGKRSICLPTILPPIHTLAAEEDHLGREPFEPWSQPW